MSEKITACIFGILFILFLAAIFISSYYKQKANNACLAACSPYQVVLCESDSVVCKTNNPEIFVNKPIK